VPEVCVFRSEQLFFLPFRAAGFFGWEIHRMQKSGRKVAEIGRVVLGAPAGSAGTSFGDPAKASRPIEL
jgi:hypothetical protein